MAKSPSPGKRSASKRSPAKRPAARNSGAPAAGPAAASAGASAAGPVTLQQARALAGVSATSGGSAKSGAGPLSEMTGKAGAGAGPASSPAGGGPTPAAVGIERRKLRIEQRDERKQRTRDYKATMQIMKKRGVKGLGTPVGASGAGGHTEAAFGGTAPAPLQILAEGDSWFDYPVPLFGGGIIARLESLIGVPILNMAKAGDEVRFMLGVEERKLLIERLTAGCPAGGAWDAMLFSGGGNDVVANPMALWIKDYDPNLSPAQHLHAARFTAALALVQAGYEDLIDLRDRLSPNTHLFFHAYDFALPDGRGICHLGPWLKPTFDLRGFPSMPVAASVVHEMLRRFAAMLTKLHAPSKGVTFINTQGTLAAQTSSWHNELHPNRAGFKQFATIFRTSLKTQFPGRVL